MYLGQQPAREPITRTPAPTDATPSATAYMAYLLADAITRHYDPAFQGGREAAIQVANAEIRPDQQFYEHEYEYCAEVLGGRFPLVSTVENWLYLLRGNMGYRLTPIPVCSYSEKIDPVTRRCVEIPLPPPLPEIQWPEEGQPEIQPRDPEQEEDTKRQALILPLGQGLMLPLGIVALLAIAMLGGRK